jgi:rhodanese-related sulfurtransferase
LQDNCQRGATLDEVRADYTPEQVAKLLVSDELQLIDVRQPHEYAAGHIANAEHIELAELASRAEELDADKSLVFYCRSGARSAMATQAFRQAGFDAYNMTGGLLEWQAADLPLEPAEGYVAET